MGQIYSQGTQRLGSPRKHKWAVCCVHWASGWKVGKGGGFCCPSGEAEPWRLLQTPVLRTSSLRLANVFTHKSLDSHVCSSPSLEKLAIVVNMFNNFLFCCYSGTTSCLIVL
jgi:hypothetical protein